MTTRTLDVVTCGEAMALFAALDVGELGEVERFVRVPAGAELNVAIGLSRLGLNVGYLSRLGRDHLGLWLQRLMKEEGLDLRHLAQDPVRPTGLMFKARRADGGDPTVEYRRAGSAASALSLADYDADYCTAARHLHLTGITPALSDATRELVFHLAAELRQAGRTVSFDPNLRPSLWPSRQAMVATLDALAGQADWVFPGIQEARLLTGLDEVEAIADYYLAKGCTLVVIKLGAAGAFYATPHERGHRPGCPVTTIVDTVGAGDGFAVGVISALLEGLPVAAAVDRGNLIGARVLGFAGDSDGLPTRTQLAEFASTLPASELAQE